MAGKTPGKVKLSSRSRARLTRPILPSDRLRTPPASCHDIRTERAITIIWIVRRKDVIIRHADNPNPQKQLNRRFQPSSEYPQRLLTHYKYVQQLHVQLEALPRPLCRLDNLGRRNRKLCIEHTVPELARDTKSVLVVSKVMLQVILLKLAVVRGKTSGPLVNGIGPFRGHTHLRWWRK